MVTERSRRYGCLIALVVLGAIGTRLALSFRNAPWFSDPSGVRPWSERAALLTPRRPAPFVAGSSLLSGVQVTTNGGEVTVAFPKSPTVSESPYVWKVITAEGGVQADLGGGTLTLECFGVGYGVPAAGAVTDWALEVPGRFFRPDLTPFQDGDFQRLGVGDWERKLRYRAGFPALKCYFRGEGMGGMRLMDLRLFDSRTGAPLESGGRNTSGSERFSVEVGLALWHPAPLEMVMDVATGPVRVFEFAAKPGITQALPVGTVGLVAAIDRTSQSWSSTSNAGQEMVLLKVGEDESQPGCTFVILREPNGIPTPYEFEFLDAQGKALPSGGSSSSGRLMLLSVRARLDEVASVRLRYYPNACRVMFHLPAVPGLPEENAKVSNLFAVRVPWMQFRQEHDMRKWLEQVLQLRIKSTTRILLPTAAFPMIFTNVTAADVLEAYLKQCPQGTAAWVFPNSQELGIGRSSLVLKGEQTLRRILSLFR